jgi:D-alanyl-D-alanine carboxypeptidase/D-alanyl-D-alanine-endopeptidase (penicillin-binding protein 4)
VVDAIAPKAETSAEASARPALDAILDVVDREQHLEVGVHVASLSGEVLYDFQGSEPRRLASNNKLFTTAAALLALGADYRWQTTVLVEDDVVRVIGTGDPSLRRIGDTDHAAAFLDGMASALRDRGLVEGVQVELDGRAFGADVRHEGWPKNQWQETYCAPVTALSVEGGCLEFVSRNGRVTTTPRVTSGVRLVKARKQGKSLSAWWGNNPSEFVYATPKGQRDEEVRLAVPEPDLVFRAWMKTGLEARGITVTSIRHLKAGDPEPTGELALSWPSHWSLADVLVVTNKKSDNFLAEVLLKTLGHELQGSGDYATGRDAVQTSIAQRFPVPILFTQADGSGMARSGEADLNTSSPAEVCRLLRLMAAEQEGPLFFDTLPVAGVEGRLAARFRDSVFQPQRIHAKTGFIRGASSLSGYLLLPDRSIAVFSFVVNFDPSKNRNTNNARFKKLQEEFLSALIREES